MPLHCRAGATLLAACLILLPEAGIAQTAASGGPGPAGSARAATPLLADPARQGYAFDDQRVLAAQIIFGLAHGVTLLARACLDVAEELRRPTQFAYEEWLMRYGERIIDSEQTLASHYFGPRAAEANEEDIARALNLPPRLELSRTPERLQDACSSFPLALSRKRYNLDLVLAMHRDEQRLLKAIEVRAAVATCRQSASPDQLPAIDTAAAAWEAANGALEKSSRVRWLGLAGDAGSLRDWESEVASSVRRRLLSGPGSPESGCRREIEELGAPHAQLSTVMSDKLKDEVKSRESGTANENVQGAENGVPPATADGS